MNTNAGESVLCVEMHTITIKRNYDGPLQVGGAV